MADATGTQAIDRAAQLLVRVVESARPPSVGELAEGAGLPKSTTSRLVGALERQGLVQRLGERGRIRPGPVLLRYANRDASATLVELARRRLPGSPMQGRDDQPRRPRPRRRRASRPGGHESLRRRHRLGRPHASRTTSRRTASASSPSAQRSRRAPTRPSCSACARAAMRRRSTSSSSGSPQSQLPSSVRGGDALAALSISGPTARLTSERIAQLAPLLIDEGDQLAGRLGHRDHARGAA